MQTPIWEIKLFGGLRILRLGEAVPRFETRKAAAVFTTLALSFGRERSRDELGEFFWGGEDYELQRTSVRQALASIRRTLGDDGKNEDALVQADRLTVRLNPALGTCDAYEFEKFISKRTDPSSLMRAVELYSGPLLPEISSEDVTAYRTRFQDQAVATLVLLATSPELSDPEAALAWASEAVRIDPLSEAAAAVKVKLLAERGRIGEALLSYRAFAQALEAAVGAEPTEEFRRLAESLRSFSKQNLIVRKAGKPAAAEFRSNVRAPLTPLFGREAELDRVVSLTVPSNPTRVVTLTGPGGIGKTRLAKEVSWRTTEAFDGAVWFVQLAEVRRADAILAKVLDALSIRPTAEDEVHQIANYLGDHDCLVVLDNLEQVLEGAVGVVQSLAEECPRVKLLCTSRESLNVGFDVEVSLEPLESPGEDDSSVAALPSVQLFLDRAKQVGSNIELNAESAPVIASICRRLEGIPLALVLAGARAHNRSAVELLEGLDRMLDFLSVDRRDLPDRHRAMRASIDWSYRLLPDFKSFFTHLSVFAGGWRAEAASDVCLEPNAEGLLQHLRMRSLVIESGNRFNMLETIREFAEGQVDKADRAALRSRHANYFAALAERAHREALGGEQAKWLELLTAEEDNLRASLVWSLENNPQQALETAAFLWFHWDVRGYIREANRWMQLAIERASGSEDSVALGRALHGLAVTSRHLGDIDGARAALMRSITIYEGAGESARLGNPLNSLGVLEYKNGNCEAARPLLERSLCIFEELGDKRMVAMVRANLGDLASLENNADDARKQVEAALAINRELGNRIWEGQNLDLMGWIALQSGDLSAAREAFEQSVAISESVGRRIGTAYAQQGLVEVAALEGRDSDALDLLKGIAEVFEDSARTSSIGDCLSRAGALAAQMGEGELAARLFGAASRTISTESISSPVLRSIFETGVKTARKLIGEESFNRESDEGRRMSISQGMRLLDELHVVSH